MLNLEKLKGILPDALVNELYAVAIKANLINNVRLAHFLAQCAHESNNFTVVVENLNYSANGLLKVFPKYFNTVEAKQYERKPEQITNRVYANRMGNGPEALGDGYKYRGRGYIQLTGKDNYKQFSDFIKYDCLADPDAVAKKYPLTPAVFFFNKNNLWQICDQGITPDIVRKVTIRINGGLHGIDDRQNKFQYYYNLLT